jgi:cob(I)alamin adenosyltransferase
MPIYTRTGDDGTTGLIGGERVSKTDLRIEASGAIDEACSAVATARAAGLEPEADAALERAQKDLFSIGSEVSGGRQLVTDADVRRIERAIDAAEEGLAPLRSLALPGGSPAACALHVARSAVRRAERRLVAVDVRPIAIAHLNRLSDLLFVLARRANRTAGVAEVPWP